LNREDPLAGPVPRPATEVSADRLMEVTHAIRSELLARGEFLPSTWVEESANELHVGTLPGWCIVEEGQFRALGFFSSRGPRAYGHVHVSKGSSSIELARQLALSLPARLPDTVQRLDVGFTGLSSEEQRGLGERLRSEPRSSALFRWALDRPLTAEDGRPLSLPAGVELRPIRAIPLDALAQLDHRAFQGSTDQSLVADSPEEDRRVLAELKGGVLGRFLDEASTTVVTNEGALIAGLLTGEQTPHIATFLDLMVDPAERKKGYATFLLRWGFRALTALGFERVRLWVTESNLPARRLYDRMGFSEWISALIYRWDRDHAVGVPHPHVD
jgi:ribosomal protein S18 acetylase RimI-like enzyme